MKELQPSNKKENKLELSDQGYVTLPFDSSQFKEFVTGLLGKPQTLSGIVVGIFAIGKDEFINLYNLLDQRITQQNNGSLIGFRARTVYSDSTSILVNSMNEFVAYNETRPVVAESLHLTFQYLIQFSDKNVPEKQEINISFVTNNGVHNKTIFDDIFIKDTSKFSQNNTGIIQYQVKHTARTWGADIQSILSNNIASLMIMETPIRRMVRKHYNRVFSLIGVLFFFGGINYYYFSKKKTSIINTAKMEEIFNLKNTNIQDLSNQIRFTYDSLYNLQVTDVILVVFITFMVTSIIFIIFLSIDFLDLQKPYSHLLLTKKSIKNKDKLDKLLNRKFNNVIITMVVSIVCGIAANFLSKYIL